MGVEVIHSSARMTSVMLHEVVVDDVGEVVGGEAVGLEQDLVVDVVVVEGDVAAELVAEGGASLRSGTLRRMV